MGLSSSCGYSTITSRPPESVIQRRDHDERVTARDQQQGDHALGWSLFLNRPGLLASLQQRWVGEGDVDPDRIRGYDEDNDENPCLPVVDRARRDEHQRGDLAHRPPEHQTGELAWTHDCLLWRRWRGTDVLGQTYPPGSSGCTGNAKRWSTDSMFQ